MRFIQPPSWPQLVSEYVTQASGGVVVTGAFTDVVPALVWSGSPRLARVGSVCVFSFQITGVQSVANGTVTFTADPQSGSWDGRLGGNVVFGATLPNAEVYRNDCLSMHRGRGRPAAGEDPGRDHGREFHRGRIRGPERGLLPRLATFDDWRPTMPADGPFSEDDFQQLKQKLKDLDQADLLIAQGVRGGIDMSAQKAESTAARQKLMQFAQSFFPGRSLK